MGSPESIIEYTHHDHEVVPQVIPSLAFPEFSICKIDTWAPVFEVERVPRRRIAQESPSSSLLKAITAIDDLGEGEYW